MALSAKIRRLMVGVALLVGCACLMTVSASSLTSDVFSCRFDASNAGSQSSTNMQLQGNTIAASVPVPLTGTVELSISCFDNASNTVFDGSVTTQLSFSSHVATLINLKDALATGVAASSRPPYFASVVLQPAVTSSIDDATLIASSADHRTSGESNLRNTSVSSNPASHTILSGDNCILSSTSCIVQKDANAADVSFDLTVEDSTSLTSSISVVAAVDQLPAGRIFNNYPVITDVEAPSQSAAFGNTLSLTVSFRDYEIANASNPTDTLSYAWSVDHVSGSTVVTPGGGSSCQLAWLSSAQGLSNTITNNGNVYSSQVTLSPVGSSGPRECRYTFTVTDADGASTSTSITIHIDDVAMVTSPVDVANNYVTILPAELVIQNFLASITLTVADKCEGVTCPAATQCAYASVCDSATGLCLPQEPKTGDSCDDGDITTRDDTCLADGSCVGTPKCQGVVCTPFSTCHLAGSCVPSTGICDIGPTRPEGSPCDDGDINTKFDLCDAAANCIGTNVASLVTKPEQDFASLTSESVDDIMDTLSAHPDTCCDRNELVCCRPCDDVNNPCQDGVYNKLFYLQDVVGSA